MVVMPIFSNISSHFSYSLDLEGSTYQFAFAWNYRESQWYLTISDVSGNIIKAGIKLVVGLAMLKTLRNYAVPPGDLYIVNISSTANLTLTKDNLGDQLQLLYYTVADIAGLA